MADVFVGSRTHALRVFTGPTEDAREYAAGLVEQLSLQGPGSPTPDVAALWQWTPENWRASNNDTASNFRRGLSSCLWTGPAGLEIRILDTPASAPESPATAPTPPHPTHEPHHTHRDPQHDRQ